MILATLLLLVSSAFLVITAFVFVFSARRVIESGAWCPWYVRVIARAWLVVGLVADVAFNWIWGTVIFREFPKEIVFTSRIKRLVKSDGWRGEKARQWAEFLNAVDPHHVKVTWDGITLTRSTD